MNHSRAVDSPNEAAALPLVCARTLARAYAAFPEEMAALAVCIRGPVRGRADAFGMFEQVCDLTVEMFPGAIAAGISVRPPGDVDLHPLVHSSHAALLADSAQTTAGDGPAVVALCTGDDVAAGDEDVARRWPVLGAALHSRGLGAVHAATLNRRPGTQQPVLTLYGSGSSVLAVPEIELFTAVVSQLREMIAGILELGRQTHLVEQLNEAMDSRAGIEQAKGVLMAVHGTDAVEAFQMLRRESHNSNVRLRDVASSFLATVTSTDERCRTGVADPPSTG